MLAHLKSSPQHSNFSFCKYRLFKKKVFAKNLWIEEVCTRSFYGPLDVPIYTDPIFFNYRQAFFTICCYKFSGNTRSYYIFTSNLPTYQTVLTYRYAQGGTNVTGDNNSRRDIWDQTEKQSSSGQLNEECQGFSAGGFCVDLAIHPQDENGRRAAN